MIYSNLSLCIICGIAGVVVNMDEIDPGCRDCAGWEFESNLPSRKT